MNRPAGSAKLLRALNTSAVLAHLLDNGPLTRADLRERTGLSKPTTSDVLRQLVDAELAMVTGYTSGGPGPNAEIYATNPDGAYPAAISVRETDAEPVLAFAVGDLAGHTRARAERTLDLTRRDAAGTVAGALRQVCVKAGLPPDRLRHLQLGVPGAYDHTADIIRHVEVPGLERPGLISAIRDSLGVPVTVDNDVNLAAIAERRRGAAAGADSFALLWLSRGLGVAIDIGGSLLRGARGGAGEIGYMPLGWPARRGRPLIELRDVLADDAIQALAAAHGLDTRTAAESVAAGGRRFLQELAGRVAMAVATIVAVLDPALVVLGGATGRAGGQRLCAAVEEQLAAIWPQPIAVVPTAVDDPHFADDAVLVGALDAALDAVRAGLLHD
jgi:predicted NBD/HSP70 family sugar kinase